MKLPKVLTILACVQAAAALPLTAQPIPTNGTARVVLSAELLNEYMEEAHTNNAGLWAARSRIKAAEENARSIPLWRDPELMAGGMAADTEMRMEDGDIIYGAQQTLPVFGKEKAARAAARADIPVEEADLEYRLQTLRKSLTGALLKAVLADEILVVSQEDLLWLETLTTAVEQRYGVGDASQVDVLRMQNERSRRTEQIRNEENEREAAYATVNRLLNRNVISAWARMELPEVFPPVPLTTRLLEMAMKFEPRLAMMKKQREQAEAMANLSRKENRPDLAAAVEARHYSRTGEGRSAEVLLKMTLPWFNQGKYKAAIRRDEARANQISYEIEDYTYELRTEIHHLVAKIDNARREAVLYRDEITPRSEQALRSAEASWQVNRGAFRDVLDSRRMLLDARTMYFKAVADQYMALTELITCCGISDLESLEAINKGTEPKEEK
jgi:outer membrane protein TolC